MLTAELLIIGGGIVGASVAYHAARAGLQVLVVDREDTGRATSAGAGIVSQSLVAHDVPQWTQLDAHAVAYYPQVVEMLADDGESDCGYATCDMLHLAFNDGDARIFAAMKPEIARLQRSIQSKSLQGVEYLSTGEAREFFPALAPVQEAIFEPGVGRVDGRQIARSLRDASVRHGATWLQENVQRLLISDTRAGGAVVDGEPVAAQAVVIAGGAWSAHFADQLAVAVGVRPQRGQIVHLGTPEQDTQHWPILHTLQGYYLVPWPDHRVAVGATREDGTGFDPSMTVAGIEEVFREAARMVPLLHDATLREIRVGLRPSSLDGLPILGRVTHIDGVLLATGHGPVGLTHGPYTGKLITDLLLERTPDVDLAPFSAARFAA